MYVCAISITYKSRILSVFYSGKEYTRADSRWGVADPTVVSLEILTVFGVGVLCCYSLALLAKDDPARHYWIVVLSTAEIYGGYGYSCTTSGCGGN